MSDEAIEPLDGELRSLLEAEARFPPESEELRARVWWKVRHATAFVPVGLAASRTLRNVVSHSVVGIMALSAGIGFAVLAGVMDRTTPIPVELLVVKPVEVEVPLPVSVSVDPTPVDSDDSRSPATSTPTSDSRDPAPEVDRASTSRPDQGAGATDTTPTIESDDTTLEGPLPLIEREQLLIDSAREGIARRNFRAAMEAIQRHEQEFAHGRFREEREALAVLALRGAGFADEASSRAVLFLAEFPNSPLRPAVENVAREGELP